jgi:hypothetical protein
MGVRNKTSKESAQTVSNCARIVKRAGSII